MTELNPGRKKKRRRGTDLATYRRLTRYLTGMKLIMVAVVACMILEGLFTVLTVSTIKPILELLTRDRLIDTSRHLTEAPFEVLGTKAAADGTSITKFTGELRGSKAADEFQTALTDLYAISSKPAYADLAEVPQIDASGWGAFMAVAFDWKPTSATLKVIVPQGMEIPPAVLQSPSARVIVAGTPEASQCLRASKQLFPSAAPKEPKVSGLIAGIKRSVYLRLSPTLERIQNYSRINSAHKFTVLGWIIAGMVLCSFFMVAASFGVGYLSSYLGNKAVQRLRIHVFEHMLSLDMFYFDAHSTGSLMSVVMQDVTAVDSAIDVLFSSVIKTPITVIMYVGAMFLISPSMTFFSFTVVPLIAALLYVLGRRVRKVSGRVQEKKGLLSKVLEEAFTGMRVVKAFNMEDREAARFRSENNKIFHMGLKTTAAEEIGTGVTQILGILTFSLMILAGGYHVIESGTLKLSEFGVFAILLTQVFRPLKGVSKTNTKIQKGLAGSDRVFRVLDEQAKIVDKPAPTVLGPLKDAMEFKNVSFAYRPDAPSVLKNINLRVAAGKAVAFVGETGSGKSTLVNLLPRFYDPTAGAITYDGVDLRDVSIKSLRSQIAIITQETVLFDDTIANNIAYGSTIAVPRERIEEAANAAKAHKFIMEKPEGYDTMIGSRGVRLSGGERQRIAIARAIVKNCPILILDEATSALDSETEALIQEALINVIKGRTVFVIAHRLSTIQNCDEIYVLDRTLGGFAECGTHEELLKIGGLYANYYYRQRGGNETS